MKPYLYFRIGREWGKIDLITLLSMLRKESKNEIKRKYKEKAIDFSIKEE